MSPAGPASVRRWQDTGESPSVCVEPSRDVPLVHVVVAQRTGSTEDPPTKEGLVQLTARLMRRTAGGLLPHDLEMRVDSLGATLSVDVTRSTVMLQGATIRRSLDDFVGVLVDVLAQPGLSEDEFRRLKRETEAEIIESRDDDRSLVRQAFRRFVFEGTAHNRPVGGTIASVRGLTPHDARALMERTWVAGNVVIAFAGDITVETADRLANRLSAAMRPGGALRSPLSEPNVPSGRRLVIVDKPERTQTQVLIGGLGTLPSDDDHSALHVANTAFGGTFTARLSREVRTKRGWSYGAYSSLPYDRQRQAFSMWTFPSAIDAPACVALELRMLEAWHHSGITQAELSRAKRYLMRSHAFAVDTAAKRVGLALESDLYLLPSGYHEDYLDRVNAVTLEQANASVRRRISPANLLIAVVGTASQIAGPLHDAIPDLLTSEIVPFDRTD